MPDEPVTRSSTSYYTKRMDEAKRTLGLPVEATLDDLLKVIITSTGQATMKQTREIINKSLDLYEKHG